MANKEVDIYYSGSEVSGDTPSSKSGNELTKAALDLYRKGIDISGLSDEEVLQLHREERLPNSGDSLSAATATPNGTPTF